MVKCIDTPLNHRKVYYVTIYTSSYIHKMGQLDCSYQTDQIKSKFKLLTILAVCMTLNASK